jgi:hypothetical protein
LGLAVSTYAAALDNHWRARAVFKGLEAAAAAAFSAAAFSAVGSAGVTVTEAAEALQEASKLAAKKGDTGKQK